MTNERAVFGGGWTPHRRSSPGPGDEGPESVTAERPVVLVVDDVWDNLLALEGILRRDDIEIVTANSGRDALEIMLRRDIAIAIIDVQMPEIDGLTLAELMRGVDRTRYVPIIFVTAGSKELTRVFRGYEAGAVDFLFKPIDDRILQSKVDVFVTLHRQRQELIEAKRVRELFVGILGHDLRNPLHGIRTSAELALRRTEDVRLRGPIDRIMRNSDRMTRLVDQLLDVTRMRLGGGLAISPASADICAVVSQVVEEFAQQKKRFSIEIVGDCAGAWDIDRVAQVVSNLVGNAIQHSPPETPVRVRVDGTDDAMVVIEVQNRGPAIPSELQGVIFEPFRGRKSAGGLGLGLFVCKEFVNAHGGQIEFESSDEGGTTFRVLLPRHPPIESGGRGRPGDTRALH